MSTLKTALLATCLALASFSAAAQTADQTKAPTHPATGSSVQSSTPVPISRPTHPANVTSGSTPAAAASAQNPSVNGYKDSTPATDAKRATAPSSSKPAPGAGAADRDPTSTDSMAKDNMPKHPTASDTK